MPARSLTHMRDIASADSIFKRVLSEKMVKKQVRSDRISSDSMQFSIIDCVLLSRESAFSINSSTELMIIFYKMQDCMSIRSYFGFCRI